jgi:FkbM family methyltransferase
MKIVGGWYVNDTEEDWGYDTWKKDSNRWGDGLITKLCAYSKGFDFALDIGAAYGATSYELAQKFNGVMAFEPNPYVHNALRKNLETLPNVKIQEVGLGSSSGEDTLFVCSDTGVSNFYTWVRKDGRVKVAVPVDMLDHYHFDKLDLIKIDAEGSEYDIILGAIDTLNIHTPVIGVEVWDVEHVYPNGKRALNLLTSIGYVLQEQHRNDYIFVHRSNL